MQGITIVILPASFSWACNLSRTVCQRPVNEGSNQNQCYDVYDQVMSIRRTQDPKGVVQLQNDNSVIINSASCHLIKQAVNVQIFNKRPAFMACFSKWQNVRQTITAVQIIQLTYTRRHF